MGRGSFDQSENLGLRPHGEAIGGLSGENPQPTSPTARTRIGLVVARASSRKCHVHALRAFALQNVGMTS